MDGIGRLDTELTALETKFEGLEVRCRQTVADEIVAGELARVKAENSRGGIPLVTAESLAAYEDSFRAKYDTELRVEMTVRDAEAKALRSAVEEKIEACETLAGERELYGRSTETGLMAGVLEELIAQRLRTDMTQMTATELARAYATWTDQGNRTEVRVIEAAVTSGDLTRLRLVPDTADGGTRDTVAFTELQRRVAERRKARVPAALHEQLGRLNQLWNFRRTHLRTHLVDQRLGIARRPRVA